MTPRHHKFIRSSSKCSNSRVGQRLITRVRIGTWSPLQGETAWRRASEVTMVKMMTFTAATGLYFLGLMVWGNYSRGSSMTTAIRVRVWLSPCLLAPYVLLLWPVLGVCERGLNVQVSCCCSHTPCRLAVCVCVMLWRRPCDRLDCRSRRACFSTEGGQAGGPSASGLDEEPVGCEWQQDVPDDEGGRAQRVVRPVPAPSLLLASFRRVQHRCTAARSLFRKQTSAVCYIQRGFMVAHRTRGQRVTRCCCCCCCCCYWRVNARGSWKRKAGVFSC